MLKWTKKQARDYMVSYHMINQKKSATPHNIKTVFNRLKTIQYDPLDVVGKNPELTLQSRIKNFSRNDLYDALYRERYLIDGWDKQMSIYETKDYPFFHLVRKDRSNAEIYTFQYRLQIEALEYIDDVVDLINKNGPLFSKNINFGKTQSHRWGRTKPSSAALDYLFHSGKVGVHSRKGAVKRYDLQERLIGELATSETTFLSDDDFAKKYLLRRIQTMGLVWNKSGVHFSGRGINNKAKRSRILNELVSESKIIPIEVEGINETLYILTEFKDIPILIKDQISFIAPLDNLIWDRELIKQLFDFDYKWEVYTPLEKRKYGYYVLPMLRGSDFIGRIEFDNYRNEETVNIKNVWFEPHVKQTKHLEELLNKAINSFTKYLRRT